MTDPIITRHLSPYVSEQGPASQLNRDRAQVAALGASNVQKMHNAPDLDALQREALIAGLGRSVTELVTRLNAAISGLRRDLAALRSNIEKINNAPAGDLINREAAAFDAAMSIVFALLKNPDQADIMRHAADSLLENVTADRLRALKGPCA